MSERYARNRHDRAPATVAAFQVRGRFLTALVLRIDRDSPDPAFYAQLDEQLRTTPQFFAGAPMVLDLATPPACARTAASATCWRICGPANCGSSASRTRMAWTRRCWTGTG